MNYEVIYLLTLIIIIFISFFLINYLGRASNNKKHEAEG